MSKQRYVDIDNVVYHLDDIGVDKDGKCDWTDVANALTHIKLCVESPGVERAEVQTAVAWRCKDYADGWIYTSKEQEAKDYQATTGCLMQPLFIAVAQASGDCGKIIEACAKLAEPWAGFWLDDNSTEADRAVVEVRREIADKIRAMAVRSANGTAPYYEAWLEAIEHCNKLKEENYKLRNGEPAQAPISSDDLTDYVVDAALSEYWDLSPRGWSETQRVAMRKAILTALAVPSADRGGPDARD